MIFASFEFLFLFLPFFLAVYYLTPFRYRNWPILILSWGFYAWWRVDFLLLLMACTLFTFLVALGMERRMRMADSTLILPSGRAPNGAQPPAAEALRPGARRAAAQPWLVAGLVGNLGVLAWFKYANLGMGTLNEALTAFGHARMPWQDIVLPIGLSFYVLQSVSYLVDVARGTIPATRNFVNYAAYKAIFAQLIAGPIVRYAEIAGELKQRRHSLELFGRGARRFMLGFAAKVCIADTLSPMVDTIFALSAPSLAESWLGAAAYTVQLFFDFAGYSAMAIGLALMIGLHFPENFNQPYLAGSIQEFWQRWHMTLSRFLRDYLYIPFGGNRGAPWKVYRNLLLTMAIGGLWHGAAWTFLIWGLWQGGLLAAHRLWQRNTPWRVPYALAQPVTLLAVLLGWVVFRAPDLGAALRYYRGMLGLNGQGDSQWGLSDRVAVAIAPEQWWVLLLGVVLIYLPLLWRIAQRQIAAAQAPMGQSPAGLLPAARGASGFLPPPRGPAVAFSRAGWVAAPCLCFLLGIVLLYSREAVPFLYFQF